MKSGNLSDEVDDDDSMVLDYSYLLLPTVTNEPKPDQRQIIDPPTRLTSITESIKTEEVPTTPDVLISPVLLNRRGGGTKREHSEVDVVE